MILDSYYRFERNEDSRSKTRLDLKGFSEHYEPLHITGRKGDVFIYLYGIPEAIKADRKRLGDLSLVNKNGYLSALFFPEVEKPNCAYGDVKNTEDAMLVVLKNDKKLIEVFIAKGKKNVVHNLYHLWLDGELDQEIESLRKRANNKDMV